MKRRKFLITSGTAILGGKTLSSISKQPAVGLNFDLVGIEDIQPSEVDSILIEFKNFELVPRYVDEVNATVTITLNVEDQSVENEATVELRNGTVVDSGDLGSATPIFLNGIDTDATALDGTVTITVDHPSVSESFQQSFTITDDSSQDAPKEGLVGWWPLHEWSGQANDLSGNDYNGSVNQPEQSTLGTQGLTGYNFTKSNNDYITMGNVLNLTNKFTISGWVRLNRNPDDKESYHGILDNRKPTTSPYEGYVLFVDSKRNPSRVGQPALWIRDRNNNQYAAQAGKNYRVDDQEWHHVAATVDLDSQNGLRIYVDGDEVQYRRNDDPTTCGNIQSRGDLQIGTVQQGEQGWTDGYLSDIRLYDRVLSESEVQSLYDRGSGNYTQQSLHDGSDSGAVSRYGFNSNSVTEDSWGTNTLTDKTGSSGTTHNSVDGDAKVFDGSDDYMTLPTFSTFDSYTISIWVNTNAPNTNSRNAFAIWENNDIAIYEDGTSWKLIQQNKDDVATVLDQGLSVRENTWIHLVAKWDGSNLFFYQNGIEVDRGTISSMRSDFNRRDTIGGRGDGAGGIERKWDGRLDDFRIYNRALSEDEISELYRWGTRGKDLRERTTTLNKSDLAGWWKLNETSVSTASDSSGNGNDGTISGTVPNQTTDPTGSKAYEFDGDQDYITVSNTEVSSPVTVTAWMYPRSAGENDYGRIFDQYDDFDLGLGDGHGNSILWEINDNNYWFGSSPLDKNNWYHLTATIDQSGTGRVYIDGTLLESKSVETVNPSSKNSYIGSMEGTSRWFDGYISDVRVYNRQLSPQEISYLYEQKF